jgi:preprotein translocase subunit YajC
MDKLISFFISDAHAAAAAQPGPPPAFQWILLAVMFVALYLILIRPQQKRMKDHRNMVSQLSKGDEVVTNGGILGRITKVGENFITLEIANNLEISVQKHAVQSLMPKGTMKSI